MRRNQNTDVRLSFEKVGIYKMRYIYTFIRVICLVHIISYVYVRILKVYTHTRTRNADTQIAISSEINAR